MDHTLTAQVAMVFNKRCVRKTDNRAKNIIEKEYLLSSIEYRNMILYIFYLYFELFFLVILMRINENLQKTFCQISSK